MADIATIGAALASIKNATEIVKAIRAAGASLEKAEASLKMAALMEALAEAKMQVVEVQEIIQEKDKKIAELESAFELKSKLVRNGDAYYEVNEESGKPKGDPYCSNCWEANHKTVHLNTRFPPIDKICPVCKNTYNKQQVPSL
jgi:hypothetical protein